MIVGSVTPPRGAQPRACPDRHRPGPTRAIRPVSFLSVVKFLLSSCTLKPACPASDPSNPPGCQSTPPAERASCSPASPSSSSFCSSSPCSTSTEPSPAHSAPGAVKYGVLALCSLLVAGLLGLLRMTRWGYSIVLAGCLLLSASYFYVFSRNSTRPLRSRPGPLSCSSSSSTSSAPKSATACAEPYAWPSLTLSFRRDLLVLLFLSLS